MRRRRPDGLDGRCNEPWGGLDATGPWGTDFDSYTTAFIANFRKECRGVPRRAEPRSLWHLPTSNRIPVLAWAGGADPQDPPPNLADLKQHFPDSRVVVLPHLGHQNNYSSCLNDLLLNFLGRGTTKGLGTNNCADEVVVPPFPLTD